MLRPEVRFILALVAGLALLTWAASGIVYRTMRDWFEKDVTLRSQLAVSGARHGLLAHWRPESAADLQVLLADLARDERILAATACSADLGKLASTGEFPEQFGCRSTGPHVRQTSGAAPTWIPWKTIASLPGGTVHVGAIPLLDGQEAVGFVVLVQDLSFIERRETIVRWFLLMAFGVLAVAASAITIVAARVSWREWRGEIQRLLRGESQRPEFQPLLQDVRELVGRIAAERQADSETGTWTPERLRGVLKRHLSDEKIIIAEHCRRGDRGHPERHRVPTRS